MLPLPRLRPACLFAAACAAALPAAAQTGADLPLWELGAVGFAATQQAYPGSDQQVRRALALPYAVYRGRVLRAERDSAGLRAYKSDRYELDIGVAGAFGSRAHEVDARRGMPELGTLVEFGPRLRVDLPPLRPGTRLRLELPLRGVFDLNDRLAHRGLVFQPGLTWQQRAAGGWNWSASTSVLLADRRLAQAFYEVTPGQATATRPAYEAQAGLLAWRVSGSVWRDLTPDWRVFGYARVDSVAGAANRDSPLVRQTTGTTVGVGVAWTWARSQARAVD